MNSYVKFGMVIGLLGFLLVMSPILHETLANCNLKRTDSGSGTNSTNNTTPVKKRTYSEIYDICLKPLELVYGVLALVSAAFLWAISTGNSLRDRLSGFLFTLFLYE